MGSISGSGRSPGGEHGNPLQYYYLENPVDRGARWVAALGLQRIGHDRSDLVGMHKVARGVVPDSRLAHRVSGHWQVAWREAVWTCHQEAK